MRALHCTTLLTAASSCFRLPNNAAITMSAADAGIKFDQLVEQGRAKDAIALLRDESSASAVTLSKERTAKLIDAACAAASSPLAPSTDTIATGGDPREAMAAFEQQQIDQQNDLLACYEVLTERGALRGFGSVVGALPALPRALSPDDQLRLTGMPTTAFAPPRNNGNGALFAGALAAAALLQFSDTLGADFRVVGGIGAAALAADRIALRGALWESAARAIRPKYRQTVVEHEGGHFLCAYLMGMPLQACLLDAWAAVRDGRFAGAAGTVFFDPVLGEGMRSGTISRGSLDRYSVVVLGGVAAEAMRNGKAEGGQADEQALIRLLSSLDGGRSWDLPKIMNQARWGASQALLLLREHAAAHESLCEALGEGKSMGEAIVAIETALDEAFGRNGELPSETRRRKLRQEELKAEEEQRAREARQAAVAAAPTASRDELEAERAEVAAKLAQVREKLNALDDGA